MDHVGRVQEVKCAENVVYYDKDVLLLDYHIVLFVDQLGYVISEIILNQEQLIEDQVRRAALFVFIVQWWHNDVFKWHGENIGGIA